MTKQHTYLLQKISKYVQEIDEVPLFGNGAPIDLETLSSLLRDQLGMENLSVHVKAMGWKEKEEIKKNISRGCTTTQVIVSPIDTPIYWVMDKTSSSQCAAYLLSDKPQKKAFSSSLLQEGFYRFILLEVLSCIQTLEPIRQMPLQLGNEEKIDYEDSIVIDCEITMNDNTFWGSLILPESFRKSWVQHFAAFPPQYVASRLSKQLTVPIGIKIGDIELLPKEWQKVKQGDFLLPDTLSNEGRGTLLLKTLPLFQVNIQNNQINLIDYAFITEDNMDNFSSEDNLSHKLETAEMQSKSIKEIPIQISIEIARLKITLDHLMNLSPGNLLELPTHADKKVSLVANGEQIGVAELVYLGETLGLKILEI